MITCPLCKRPFLAITNTHLREKHGLTAAEFRRDFAPKTFWSGHTRAKLEGNAHARGLRHTTAFKKRFIEAISKPRPDRVRKKIRATWRKRLTDDPEFAAKTSARGHRYGGQRRNLSNAKLRSKKK